MRSPFDKVVSLHLGSFSLAEASAKKILAQVPTGKIIGNVEN